MDTLGLTDRHEIELAKALATMEGPPYLWEQEPVPTRLQLARELVATGAVQPIGQGLGFRVVGKTATYEVGNTCSCGASKNGKTKWCKHYVAVELWSRWQARLSGAGETVWTTMDGAPTSAPLDEYGPEPDDEEAEMFSTLGVQGASAFVRTAHADEDAADAMASAARMNGQGLPVPPQPPSLRPLAAIMADLGRPLPRDCVAVREQQGHKIPYLHWWVVADILDAYAPGWSGAIVRHEEIAACTMTYRLTIPTADYGPVSQEATGREAMNTTSYGDPSSNAESTAFRRAAAKFGVGRWLYARSDGTAQAFADYLRAGRAGA